jgi:acyl-CoA thioesterase-1
MTWLKFKVGILLTAGSVLFAAETPIANAVERRVVVLGDSITAGYGLDPEQAYPALLQNKIDSASLSYTVTNAGVSGDTTAGGLRRIQWVLGQKGADVLVIALGGNDGLRGVSPTETKRNLVGIVDKARANNPHLKVVIAGMQMPANLGADFTRQFAKVFREVAEEKNAAFVPFLLEGVGGREKLNQDDRIHPTAQGQAVVAETVWAVLKDQLRE